MLAEGRGGGGGGGGGAELGFIARYSTAPGCTFPDGKCEHRRQSFTTTISAAKSALFNCVAAVAERV